ncbi:MAG: type IV secretory system conjugative DNA transfer family protein, partial [Firmicutes bacterium]|nr:type IV secretory system conjugative DNA transfer family protein [Bacillota bacterium]
MADTWKAIRGRADALGPWRAPALFLAGAALLLALAPLLRALPGLPLLLGACGLAWLACRHLRPDKRLAFAALPALCGFLLAWIAASTVHDFQDRAHKWKPHKSPEPPPVVWSSWLSARPLSNPANRAGRIGLWLGAFGGLLGAAWAGKKLGAARHGPGVVQGEKVVRGGWADDAHVAGMLPANARFGPPKPGDGGIVVGRIAALDGPPDPGARVLRLLVGPGGLAFHGAWFGASGSGKTFGFVCPNIVSAAHEEWNLVVSDPKGELVAGKWVPGKSGKLEYVPGLAGWLDQQGYKVVVLNFKNPGQGTHRWNPLLEARNEAEFRFAAEAMILSSGRDNPFFTAGEMNLFTALLGLVRYAMDPPYRHLRSALSVLAWPVEAIDAAFEDAFRSGRLDFYYYEKWKAAKPLYGNFMTGVQGKVAKMTEGPLARMLAGHDIDLEEVGGPDKVALFVILPTTGDDLKPVLACFFSFLFKRLVEKAEANYGRLPRPVRYVLDEFGNIGYIANFDQR